MIFTQELAERALSRRERSIALGVATMILISFTAPTLSADPIQHFHPGKPPSEILPDRSPIRGSRSTRFARRFGRAPLT